MTLSDDYEKVDVDTTFCGGAVKVSLTYWKRKKQEAFEEWR